MKKIIASAVGLALVSTVAVTTASAVENKFGGYWRTRVVSQSDFNSTRTSFWRVDNRTRLYYTAKFNDDFKFVNKFEFNTNWGDETGGDIGSDGMGIWRVKHSYADFNLGPVNTKVGIFGSTIARGFIFDDDHSGLKLTGKFGNVTVPFLWVRAEGEYTNTSGRDNDIFAVIPSFKAGDSLKVTPYFVYQKVSGEETDNWYLGADVDLNMDAVSAWGSFIYNGGTNNDLDNKGFLVAAGASVSVVHGQAFYATGDDNAADGDNDAYMGVPGTSYYWAEIMGLGVFDMAASNGSPANVITNIMAVNVGVKIKPMDKLTLNADVWYAALAEDDANGETDLGTEVDLKVTYALMDNLNLDLVGAYLFAGDATGDDDPVEVGARLSLKF
ncbi:hypothetical protein [Desulfomarina sp.]